jgi:hypothetical protein
MIVMCGIPTQSATPMGMYCTVTQRYDTANNTWAQITNMSARSDFPGTVMSGNGLVLPAGPLLLTGRGTWEGTVPDVAIYVDGVLRADSTALADEVSKQITFSFSAAGGEIATLWTNPSSTGTANRVVQSGELYTYLTATPV